MSTTVPPAAGRLLIRISMGVPTTVLGLAGAVTEGWPVLAWGAVLAVVGASGLTWMHRSCGDVVPGIAHPATGACALATVPAVLSGAMVLGAAGGLLVMGLLTAGSVAFALWLPADQVGTPASRAGAPAPSVPDDDVLRQVLRAATTARLLDEWRVFQDRLDRGIPAGLAEVRFRAALIDELATRDPAGTARWLVDDPTGPPERHIHREPGTDD